jgi:threonine dehydratase
MTDHKQHPISFTEVLKAQKFVYEYLTPSALIHYENLSALLNAEIFIKHENHNPTGTFKIRGGINLMHQLKNSRVEGVITFSTGNHGLSIAQSAAWLGLDATIVVPEGNNPTKNQSIKSTGATLTEAGNTFEEASIVVKELVKEKNLYFAHPANEPHLINGVGTEFVEVIEALPDLDIIILPIGAGSEAAAASIVLKAVNPDIEIIAVQAESSCAAYKSWKSGTIVTSENMTYAGGFATGIAYEIPFEIYKSNLTDFVLLSEEEIYQAISLAGYYTHNLLEGAGASTIMAAIKLKERLKGKKVVLQFSGCNASADEIDKAYSLASFTRGYR